ncbi:PqqD family protein [Nautilia sp. PV-1]|uniref:PqqD family protein n=1 Tax=Nautilia sp. PV-1 TaxID=2579250 RepID=UPI000FDB4C5A|nr:PqqD family protein [Nautilia sp. PV-1]AZV46395.1 PqqD family protein [Nautilia sp. PV-1]
MLLNEMIIDENNMAFIPSLGTSYQLNKTAKEIIDLLKQGKNKDEIVKIIAENTGANWRDVYVDVEDFFQKLKIYGLIQ